MEFWKSITKLKINWHPAWWESKPSWRAGCSRVMTERITRKTGRPPRGSSVLLLFFSFFLPEAVRCCFCPIPPTERRQQQQQQNHHRNKRVSRDAERKSTGLMRGEKKKKKAKQKRSCPRARPERHHLPTWGLFNTAWCHILPARTGGAPMTRHLGSTCACVQEAKPRPLTPDVFRVIQRGVSNIFGTNRLFMRLLWVRSASGLVLTVNDLRFRKNLQNWHMVNLTHVDRKMRMSCIYILAYWSALRDQVPTHFWQDALVFPSEA